ncbi:MAG: MBL fold metallo-hydrolase [Gemmatimonadetes bacterium]|nr:MBL fold metallo-hydrolase [Gemmatimonadota bacterium]
MRPPVLLLLVALSVLTPATAAGQVAPRRRDPGRLPPERIVNRDTKVVLLGTGTPNADPDRFGPAVAIIANGKPYLVDAGPGVVRRAAASEKSGVVGLAVKNLNIVFLTHLHSDHTLGLPDLMLSPWTLERTEPIRVYGPKGVKAMTKHILEAYAEDIDIRLNGGEPSNQTGWQVEAHEIDAGVVYQDSNVKVTAFRVDHGKWPESLGYRFDTPDRVVVVSGDTRKTEAIVQQCQECDVLVHEVYSAAGFQRRPPEWQRYHSQYHTSSAELAELASRAKPKLLILYHQLFWGTSDTDLVSEITSRYGGRVVSGKDLDVF